MSCRRLGFRLAFLSSALASLFFVSQARAYDGAGLFAFPAESTVASEVDETPAHESSPTHALASSLVGIVEAALEYLGPQQTAGDDVKIRPLMLSGIGGGVSLVGPLCESGCTPPRQHPLATTSVAQLGF
jgi:hypothetical protein